MSLLRALGKVAKFAIVAYFFIILMLMGMMVLTNIMIASMT